MPEKFAEFNEEKLDSPAEGGEAEVSGADRMEEKPLAEMIKDLEAEGWYYQGPVSIDEISKAMKEGREVKIVAMKEGRYLFDKSEE